MSKESTKKALDKYLKGNLPKQPRNKKNDCPEKRVVKELKEYLTSLGCSMRVVESKAFFSERAGIYLSQATDSGFSDLCGNFPNGLAIFIEVKAKGRRSTLRPQQYDFLMEKISTNCFAACIDDLNDLKTLIDLFKFSTDRKKLLIDHLPQRKNVPEEEDLNF